MRPSASLTSSSGAEGAVWRRRRSSSVRGASLIDCHRRPRRRGNPTGALDPGRACRYHGDPMRLFDAHLHFFSREFFNALARQAGERTGERPEELLSRTAIRAGFELPPEDPIEHLQRWLAELDRHGVDKAVVFASLPEEAEAVRAACLDAEDRMIPYVCVNPAAPGGGNFARRALAEMGFRGLLLFPSLHHYDVAGEVCRPVLEEARSAGAVVLVHCGVLAPQVRDLLGFPRAYDLRFASPLAVSAAANRYPEIPFVIPHFGSGLFRETLLAGAQSRNVHVDTSSSNGWMKLEPGNLTLDEVFRRTIEAFGPERIIFGTDSTTFPRGYRADVYRSQSAALERIGASIEPRNLIFGETLARILHLRP